MRTSEPGFDRAFLRPESERRGSAVGVFPIQRLARTSHASEGIHSLCSRRWPGGNVSNVAVAA